MMEQAALDLHYLESGVIIAEWEEQSSHLKSNN